MLDNDSAASIPDHVELKPIYYRAIALISADIVPVWILKDASRYPNEVQYSPISVL